jgi:hypothetical protein
MSIQVTVRSFVSAPFNDTSGVCSVLRLTELELPDDDNRDVPGRASGRAHPNRRSGDRQNAPVASQHA